MARPRTRGFCLPALLICGCTAARQPTLADGHAAAVRGDRRAAVEIYATVARQHPDTMEAALASDAAIQITGNRLLPEPSYDCGSDAVAAYAEAERRFDANDMDGALPAYERAVDLCPQNAMWWIHAGDAYFARGRYERAKVLYLQGLQLDPWNRSGHRFLSDTELHLGDPGRAYQSAVLAVVSDPTYEAGWQWLKQLTHSLGGQWNRMPETKPRIASEDGKPRIILTSAYENQRSLTVWIAYGVARWSLAEAPPQDAPESVGPGKLSPREWQSLSPLERERYLLACSLDVYGRMTSKDPAPRAVFWDTVDKAQQAGLTDEAIYIHLMDGELAPSYASYRAQNTSRLIDYVTRFIAPLPSPPGREV